MLSREGFCSPPPPPPPSPSKKKNGSPFQQSSSQPFFTFGMLFGWCFFFWFNPKNFSNFSQGLRVLGSHPKKHRNGSENPGFQSDMYQRIRWLGQEFGNFHQGWWTGDSHVRTWDPLSAYLGDCYGSGMVWLRGSPLLGLPENPIDFIFQPSGNHHLLASTLVCGIVGHYRGILLDKRSTGKMYTKFISWEYGVVTLLNP